MPPTHNVFQTRIDQWETRKMIGCSKQGRLEQITEPPQRTFHHSCHGNMCTHRQRLCSSKSPGGTLPPPVQIQMYTPLNHPPPTLHLHLHQFPIPGCEGLPGTCIKGIDIIHLPSVGYSMHSWVDQNGHPPSSGLMISSVCVCVREREVRRVGVTYTIHLHLSHSVHM